MGREGRDYWEEQLSEYWDSGLTIQEYSELIELPYESRKEEKCRLFSEHENVIPAEIWQIHSVPETRFYCL